MAENLLRDIRSFDGLITTASIGVAEYIKSEHREHWLKRADENMYEAKRAGRNRVVSTPPEN
jgi:diguanylate cyclase (GGDEF)-like protein